MIRRVLLVTVMVWAWAWWGAARARSAEPLTLHEAYRAALAGHERVHSAMEGSLQADFAQTKARAAVYPRLILEGRYARRPDVLTQGTLLLRSRDEHDLALRLEQVLYAGGRHRATLAQLRGEIAAASANLMLVKEDLLMDVARAFYGVLNASRDLEIQERELTRLEAHERVARTRVRVGEATQTVLLRAQAELAGARAERVARMNALEVAKDRLALLTKRSPDLEVVEPEHPRGPDDPAEVLAREALHRRPDIRMRHLAEQIARDGVRVARSGHFPTLTLEGMYTRRDRVPRDFLFVEDETIGMLRLSVPLFEGGLHAAETHMARSRLRQAELDRMQREAEVAAEVRRSRLAVEALTSAMDDLRARVAFARENYGMVEKQFAVGLATTADVLDANSLLLDADRRLARAGLDRDLAVLELQRSAGTFLAETGLE